MPKNSPLGVYMGIFSFLFGFGLIWYMFWLTLLSTIGIIVCIIAHLYQKHPGYHLTPQEVATIEAGLKK